ncbi:hypothetical protein TWF481_001734 [Arthrobotrys musiformis]|uniref:F-box domain-containing protein n=1 Tax=Arthrobotrys musiformis TaxID=47236 RepID=A0AAV9VWI8_9PEZI
MESTPHLSPLESLPQELLSAIIVHFEPETKIAFLRTSKRLYHATRPHIWHTLKAPRTRSRKDNPTKYTTTLYKLANIAKEIGVENMGFGYVKKLVFRSGDVVRHSLMFGSSDPALEGLLGIVNELLVEGKMDLQEVELYWDDINCASGEAARFFNILKEYKKLNLPQKPSIGAKMTSYFPTSKPLPSFPIGSLALECITKLQLGFPGYPNSEVELRSTPVSRSTPDIVGDIELLTNTLRGTHYLRNLSLSWKDYVTDTPASVLELPQLKELQDAITDLKNLYSLTLSGYLFHPSFFVIPPENTKVLMIKQEVSIAWWRKFAEHPFTGLEALCVSTGHAGTASTSQWLSGDDEEMVFYGSPDFEFLLGSVGIKGLKRFGSYYEWYYRPDDFETLLRKQNPGLKDFDFGELDWWYF